MKIGTSHGSDALVIRRYDNWLVNCLTRIYKHLHLLSNTLISLLNVLLAISNSWCVRLIQHGLHILTLPLRIIHCIITIFCAPIRLLLLPLRLILNAIGGKLCRLPEAILNLVNYFVRFLLGSRTTPFPRLPEIDFFYTR